MEYGLIGEHLPHSFSKIIHEKIGSYTGRPYPYELKELEPEEVGSFLQAADFKGINVTIPYKQTVIPYLDGISGQARQIGAVNTIVNRGGKLYGYNTDYYGMRDLLLRNNIDPSGKKVLILGREERAEQLMPWSPIWGRLRSSRSAGPGGRKVLSLMRRRLKATRTRRSSSIRLPAECSRLSTAVPWIPDTSRISAA